MINFSDLLDTNLEELPKQSKIPVGHYVWSVDQLPESAPSKNGAGTNVSFRLKCVAPVDPFDGDPEELEAFNPVGSIRTLYFYIPTEAKEGEDEGAFKNRVAGALQRLVTFLTQHLQVTGDSVSELLSNCLYHQAMIEVKHVPDQRDKTILREELGKSAPVSAE